VTAPAAGRPKLVPPPARELWRIGFRERPLAWRHPRPLPDTPPSDEAPGGRFDAPNGEFATAYFASTDYGACIEKLAPIRPRIGLQDRIAAFLTEDADPEHDVALAPVVPREFCTVHVFVTATIRPEARFVDVDDPDTHTALHAASLSPALRALLDEHNMRRIDRGAFLHPDRRLTRHLALQLYTLYGGEPMVVGLRYSSSLDPGTECWAIWDTGEDLVVNRDRAPIDFSNISLRAARQTPRPHRAAGVT
jgi:hypothetical protein